MMLLVIIYVCYGLILMDFPTIVSYIYKRIYSFQQPVFRISK